MSSCFKPCLFKRQRKSKVLADPDPRMPPNPKRIKEKLKRKEKEKTKEEERKKEQKKFLSNKGLTVFLPGVSPKAATMAKY